MAKKDTAAKIDPALRRAALTALDAGIEEANRRAKGEFDGLLGSLDPGGSRLLSDIVDELRSVLLDKYTDEEARALIAEFEPRLGYRNMPVVPDDVDLALRLLNLVASALRCEPGRRQELFLGPRDARRQQGTRKPRRPEVNEWIERQLRREPGAKSPELWSRRPDWMEDQVGYERFSDRVTDVRKMLKTGASK
ncbi:hypothetical protein [Arenimonas sp. MALMAid1274]|uniref:hypothetical protein n=1 Tax=Arenimonas sp. MALMAid1274 TaxID=3411630 RepID=UPI003B9F4450